MEHQWVTSKNPTEKLTAKPFIAGKPSAERLREAFSCNPRAGIVIWRNPTSRRVQPGDRAGCLCPARGGIRIIGLNKHRIVEQAWIWWFAHGEWPVGDCVWLDGDHSNNKLENLSYIPDAHRSTGIPTSPIQAASSAWVRPRDFRRGGQGSASNGGQVFSASRPSRLLNHI